MKCKSGITWIPLMLSLFDVHDFNKGHEKKIYTGNMCGGKVIVSAST